MLAHRIRTFKLPNRIRIFNKYVTNRLLRGFANLSHSPFAIIRHVGRRSGKPYETVIWVCGGGAVVWHKRVYVVGKPEPIDAKTALPAFPAAFRPIFRRAGMQDFVWMSSSGSESVRA